ncbi:MAG: DUF420 domain-containing protein [Alphaproteobacteria bacterium]
MNSPSLLPHLNAILNTTSTILLLVGYAFIRRKQRAAHRMVMISAIFVSAMFLGSYLYYHFTMPIFQFSGTGQIRTVYYAVMISHVVLALVAVPMVLMTAMRALKGEFERHRSIAVFTLPLWLYVSVSGVVVYYMLFHLYPTPAGT